MIQWRYLKISYRKYVKAYFLISNMFAKDLIWTILKEIFSIFLLF